MATPIPINPLSQADFLSLIDRLLPASFIDPIKNVGPGYELYQAAAAAMQRASQAVAILDRAAFIGTASSGGLSTALVQFARPNNLAGPVTISVGTVVSTSATGRDYILLTDAYLTSGGANDLLSAPVLVQAVAESYEFNNALGPIVTAAKEVIIGDIDKIKALITKPDYADPSIYVLQVEDAGGGSMDDLDQIGRDQDMPRQPGESDAHYRARLRQLPDVVSPGAIQRAVYAFFQQFAPFGPQWAKTYFIETWACGLGPTPAQLPFQTCYDMPSWNVTNNVPANALPPRFPTPPPYLPPYPAIINQLPPGNPFANAGMNTCFFFDDTRGPGSTNIPNPSGYYGRWMDYGDYRGAFIIICPNLACISDLGMFYDDTSADPIGTGQQVSTVYATALGARGVPGYDLANVTSGGIGVLAPPALDGAYDGVDLGKLSTYTALDTLLGQIKAAGVVSEIVVFRL